MKSSVGVSFRLLRKMSLRAFCVLGCESCMCVTEFGNQPPSIEAGELGLKRGTWFVASRLELAPATVLLLCWGWRSIYFTIGGVSFVHFYFIFSNPRNLRHVSGTLILFHFAPLLFVLAAGCGRYTTAVLLLLRLCTR